jgi:hypothetical protein
LHVGYQGTVYLSLIWSCPRNRTVQV